MLLAALLFSAPAVAAEWGDKEFADFTELSIALRGRGIDPGLLHWASINNACGASFGKPAENNRCKYKFAIWQSQFRSDRSDCRAQSEQDLMEYEKSDFNINIITNADGKVQQNNNKLTKSQKSRYKNSSYRTCMRDMGWNDSSNYLAGKEED